MTLSSPAARHLSRTIQAHPLGVGCRSTGIGGLRQDRETLGALRAAVEAGATLFVTADTYGQGHAERILGQLIEEHRGAGLQIVTKIQNVGTAPHPYASPHVRHQLEQTLDNLRDDHVALYVLPSLDFGPDDRYLHEAAEALTAFRRMGVIGAIGLRGPHPSRTTGADQTQRFAKVFEVVQPDVVLTRFNPLQPLVIVQGEDLFTFTRRRKVGVLLCAPLARGTLADTRGRISPMPDLPASAWAALRRGLRPLREHVSHLPGGEAAIALRHCIEQSPNTVVVAGFGNRRHIVQNFTNLYAFDESDIELADSVYAPVRAELHHHTLDLAKIQ
ncbi:aldo/keto reductase [Kitasatospora sp. NBC_01246]|uniref:aldo/keto reductase n=1 Tax=Kitasatospora sp. NBC_01246 TaxID=2903570 RepID=UPI002E33A188|nr:aldo/keto reductase [Kitasatospora sp. NBC_01246]